MWYLVLRQATKPRAEWTVTLDQHLVWMKEQHDTFEAVLTKFRAQRAAYESRASQPAK